MVLSEEKQFRKNLDELANQIKVKKNQLSDEDDKFNEQDTKNFFILPFIRTLGYNTDNPEEVKFEFPADQGLEKGGGEKIDIAIKKDKDPIIFIEIKPANTKLDNFVPQLRKYFQNYNMTRFGIVTNGEEYRFFSDTQKDNVMDKIPFLVVNFSKLRESDFTNLMKFKKENYHEKSLCDYALDLHYLPAITETLKKLFLTPSPDFIDPLFRTAFPGKKITPTLEKKLPEIVKEAIRNATMETVQQGFKAIQDEAENIVNQPTPEENEGYYIVKGILNGYVDPENVTIRPFKSNSGILFNDSQNTPICRICLRGKEKYVIVIDNEKRETKFNIEKTDDLFKYADYFKKIGMFHDKKMKEVKI